MKLRNFIIVLLAVFMVFAFASCKNEPVNPTPGPGPEPGPGPDPGPVEGTVYQIRVTEGVDKDYWNRDKLKLQWVEDVNEGDVISLKYRSERDIYQWDIRDGSLKWVYESKKGSFTDPVLGEDGWYTLTYTFAKDINGADVDYPNEQFSVFFRGNFVTTDMFEIKDITLNGRPLAIEEDTIISAAELVDPAVDFDWSVKNYAVLFATGTPGEVDKTPIAEKVVAGGFVTGAPIAKEGYTLTIYNDTAHTSIFDPTTPITEEKIFYYEYVGVPRTVTFELNGGAFPADAEIPETVANGDMLAVPAEPVLEGKAFKAWYADEALTTPWNFNDAVTGDLKLYAAYGEPVTVTFELNGGSFGEDVPNTKVVCVGNAVAMPDAPTNGTKMFLGWFADENFETPYVFSTPVTEPITIYASWVNTTKITLDLNYEGAPEPTQIDAGLDVVLAENDEALAALRAGYVFDGWYDDAACETAHDFSAVVTGPFTLYAKWADLPLVRLTATKGISDGLYSYDKFELHFDRKVNEGDVLSVTYRSTRPLEEFNIRTVRDGLNPPDIRWVYEGTTGIEFTEEDGWTTATYTFGLSVDRGYRASDGKSDKTVKAITSADYDVINNVEFHLRGNIIKGDYLEIKEIRWNDEPIADIAAVAKAALGHSGDVVREEAKVEEIAASDSIWTGETSYYVIFYADPTQGGASDYKDDDGKNTGIGVVVAENALVEKPADPVRDGFTFVGWCKDKTYDGSDPSRLWDFDTYTVTENRKLYAIWAEAAAEPEPEPVASVVYTVTVVEAGGSRIQLKWADQALKANDVVSFKFKGITLGTYTVRSIDPNTKYVDGAAFTGEADEDGWYTFTTTITADGTGLGLSLFPTTIANGDVLTITDLAINGNALALAQANEWPGSTLTIAVAE